MKLRQRLRYEWKTATDNQEAREREVLRRSVCVIAAPKQKHAVCKLGAVIFGYFQIAAQQPRSCIPPGNALSDPQFPRDFGRTGLDTAVSSFSNWTGMEWRPHYLHKKMRVAGENMRSFPVFSTELQTHTASIDADFEITLKPHWKALDEIYTISCIGEIS